MHGLRHALPFIALVACGGGAHIAEQGEPLDLDDGGVNPPNAATLPRDGGTDEPDATTASGAKPDAGDDAMAPADAAVQVTVDAAPAVAPPNVCATSNGVYSLSGIGDSACMIGGVHVSWNFSDGTPNPCPGTSSCAVNVAQHVYTGKLSRSCTDDAECADYPPIFGKPACVNYTQGVQGRACNTD